MGADRESPGWQLDLGVNHNWAGINHQPVEHSGDAACTSLIKGYFVPT